MVEVASKILKNERALSLKRNYLQLKILLNLFKMVEAEIFYNFLKKKKFLQVFLIVFLKILQSY